MSIRDRLKTTGVWYFTDGMTVEAAGEFAARIETLGYSTLWLPDTGRWSRSDGPHRVPGDEGPHSDVRHRDREHLPPTSRPDEAGRDRARRADGWPLRSRPRHDHARMVAGVRQLDYSKPLSQMHAYLEAMRLVLRMALRLLQNSHRHFSPRSGQRCSTLSHAAADGAHPYWTTPEHTAEEHSDPRARQTALRRAEGRAHDRHGGRTSHGEWQGAVRVHVGMPNTQQLAATRVLRRRDRAARRAVHRRAASRGAMPTRCAVASRHTTTRARTTCASNRCRSRGSVSSIGARSKRSRRESVDLQVNGLPRWCADRRATGGRGGAGSAS